MMIISEAVKIRTTMQMLCAVVKVTRTPGTPERDL